jgi:hypothetical protein
VAAPAEFPAWLIEGFALDQMSPTEIVRSTHDLGLTPVDTPVILLGPEHREAIGALISIAWVTGRRPFPWRRGSGRPWGWKVLGTGATHPVTGDRGLRAPSLALRLALARDPGCRMVHAEVQDQCSSSPKLPFEPLYDRRSYSLAC